ncbi:UEV domain-containing protein [Blastocladiella britannica]|nr:UEV domain-containing protein [Blastocladiella britannica]
MDPAVRHWLATTCQTTYREHNPGRALAQIEALLTAFPLALTPRLDTHVGSDGDARRLLCIAGTVPVAFNRVSYNIPLEIWAPPAFPLDPPIVYVRPTATMCINPTRCVDPNGAVTHPALDRAAHWSGDLVKAVSSLQKAFAAEPPVYAKPASSAALTSSGSTVATTVHAAPSRPPPPPIPATAAGANLPPPYMPSPGSYSLVPSSMTPSSGSVRPSQQQPPARPPPTATTSMWGGAPPPSLPPPIDPAAVQLANARARALELLYRHVATAVTPLVADLDTLAVEVGILAQASAQIEATRIAVDAEVAAARAQADGAEGWVAAVEATVAEWEARPPVPPEDLIALADPVAAQYVFLFFFGGRD